MIHRLPRHPFRDQRTLAKVVTVLLAIAGLCYLVQSAFFAMCYVTVATRRAVVPLDQVGNAIGTVSTIALVLCGIAFLRWFRYSYENALAFGLRSNLGPAWASFGWIIPVVFLVMPGLLAGRMWRQAGRERVGGLWWVLAWWLGFLISRIGTLAITLGAGQVRGVASAKLMLIGLFAASLLAVVDAFFAVVFVRRLTRAQGELHMLAGAATAFGEAGETMAAPAAVDPTQPRPVSTTPGERPVTGSACGRCGQRIDSHVEASVCTACDLPLHDTCLREGTCPHCRSRELDVGFQLY